MSDSDTLARDSNDSFNHRDPLDVRYGNMIPYHYGIGA